MLVLVPWYSFAPATGVITLSIVGGSCAVVEAERRGWGRRMSERGGGTARADGDYIRMPMHMGRECLQLHSFGFSSRSVQVQFVHVAGKKAVPVVASLEHSSPVQVLPLGHTQSSGGVERRRARQSVTHGEHGEEREQKRQSTRTHTRTHTQKMNLPLATHGSLHRLIHNIRPSTPLLSSPLHPTLTLLIRPCAWRWAREGAALIA